MRPSMVASGTHCTQYAHCARSVSLFLRPKPAGVAVFEPARQARAMTTNRCVAALWAFIRPVENAGAKALGDRRLRGSLRNGARFGEACAHRRRVLQGGIGLAREAVHSWRGTSRVPVRFWTGSHLGCGMHGEAGWSPGIHPNYQNVQKCATVRQKVSAIDEYCQPCMILRSAFKWFARSGAGSRDVIG